MFNRVLQMINGSCYISRHFGPEVSWSVQITQNVRVWVERRGVSRFCSPTVMTPQ